jgi:hypothetical protein
MRSAQPQRPVLLDIEVLIAPDSGAAFAALDRVPEASGCVRYVGTARGLAGLIDDVQRLGIADAVILLPLDDTDVTHLMLEEMAPGLAAR